MIMKAIIENFGREKWLSFSMGYRMYIRTNYRATFERRAKKASRGL